MQTPVKEVHVQDLARVLEAEFSPTEVQDAVRRFEIGEAAIHAAGESILEGIREVARTDRFDAVLAYLIDTGTWDDTEIAALEAALVGSPLSIRVTDDGSVELIERVESVADRSIPDKRAVFEEAVPGVVLTQITAAESNLAAGEYDMAAAEVRRAMDMLVVGGFDEGLEELAEHGLIQLGDEHEHSDATMLYVAYGYCSFLGGDPERKGFETSRLQAEMALVVSVEAIDFILQTMAAAEEQGIELRRWERP